MRFFVMVGQILVLRAVLATASHYVYDTQLITRVMPTNEALGEY